ncbi:MAG: hypothetical protein MZV70_44430 [Desulfobacterales bacterium]|nr:hypothetical protein [Desulfobacterales bacterium]
MKFLKGRWEATLTALTGQRFKQKSPMLKKPRKTRYGVGTVFVVLADNQEVNGLKVIDLGAGHSSSGETLCGRVVMALKSQALLNESVVPVISTATGLLL